MYASTNFKTKKALKEAVEAYNKAQASGSQPGDINYDDVPPVTLYAPGLGEPKRNGTESVEGPCYPKPHTWYAQVEVKDGVVVKVK